MAHAPGTRPRNAGVGAFRASFAVQLVRLRRMEFLPVAPGIRDRPRRVPGQRKVGERRCASWCSETPPRPASAWSGRRTPSPTDGEAGRRRLLARRARRRLRRAGARVADLVRSQLPHALEPHGKGETEPFLPAADLVAVVIGSNDATHSTLPRRSAPTSCGARGDPRRGARRAPRPGRGPGVPRRAPCDRALILLTDQYARFLRPISRSEAARVGAAYGDLAAEVPHRIRGRVDILSRTSSIPLSWGTAPGPTSSAKRSSATSDQ